MPRCSDGATESFGRSLTATEKSRVMRRIVVRSSPAHGRGVFAVTRIPAGERILEYKGKLVFWREAQRRYERSAAEDGNTFFFDLDDGRVIDGAQGATRRGGSIKAASQTARPSKTGVASSSTRCATSSRVRKSSSIMGFSWRAVRAQR
jgi:hypothetical protein